MSYAEYIRAMRALTVVLAAGAGVASLLLAFIAGCVYLAGNWPT